MAEYGDGIRSGPVFEGQSRFRPFAELHFAPSPTIQSGSRFVG